MGTLEYISIGVAFCLSVGAFIISLLQFKEKGMLFNNAYIYTSKSERKNMNKKPHYRQSAIVFLMIGLLFLLIGVQMLIQHILVFSLIVITVIALIIYAIASSISTLQNEKK